MENWRRWIRSRSFACLLWVGLCFALTSAVYLSWLDRLVALAGSSAADWLSMVAGYLFQAAGIGIVVHLLRRYPGADRNKFFRPAALLFGAASFPALLADSAIGAAAFGFAMNLFCGIIAGFYLYAIAATVEPERRSLVFGGGYALATVIVGLLALIDRGGFLHGEYALLLYLPLALAAALATPRLGLLDLPGKATTPPEEASRGDLGLACAVVVLLCLVKNLGFCFPSADIASGLIPELSRIPYALGLVAAGWVNDRSRRHGMICAVAALVIPFIMLVLTSEPVPRTICWGLGYVFFAFFSVLRAALFLDLAARTRRWELAPLGLLIGRLGDVAGTALGMLLAENRVFLIAVTALLFFPTVFLCFRLYRKLYEPEVVHQKSEQEVFEAFCLHNDLSSREREVLRMVLANRANGEIAEALFITESTVKYHMHNMLQKTGCKNRTELQRKYAAALYPGIQDTPALTVLTKENAGA